MPNPAFITAEPFPHLVIDSVFRQLAEISAEIDQMPQDAWHRYDSPDEQGKRACHHLEHMGPETRRLLAELTSEPGVKLVEHLTGLTGLSPDSSLYGGGVHVTEPGGFLGLHLDNEVHPNTGMHRRLNLIIYCTPNWQDFWGGELELWDRERRSAAVKIAPLFGRCVLMETASHSYHAAAATWTNAPPRKSLALYYWSPPRQRARFLSAAGETPSAAREAARLSRAGLGSPTRQASGERGGG